MKSKTYTHRKETKQVGNDKKTVSDTSEGNGTSSQTSLNDDASSSEDLSDNQSSVSSLSGEDSGRTSDDDISPSTASERIENSEKPIKTEKHETKKKPSGNSLSTGDGGDATAASSASENKQAKKGKFTWIRSITSVFRRPKKVEVSQSKSESAGLTITEESDLDDSHWLKVKDLPSSTQLTISETDEETSETLKALTLSSKSDEVNRGASKSHSQSKSSSSSVTKRSVNSHSTSRRRQGRKALIHKSSKELQPFLDLATNKSKSRQDITSSEKPTYHLESSDANQGLTARGDDFVRENLTASEETLPRNSSYKISQVFPAKSQKSLRNNLPHSTSNQSNSQLPWRWGNRPVRASKSSASEDGYLTAISHMV